MADKGLEPPDGYRCLHCGETGMTEDEFIFHRCPEDTEPDVDDEDPGMQPTEYDRLLSREAEQWAIETGREPEPGA